MSLFKNMFGRKDPVEEMRRLHARQDWAGILSIAAGLDRTQLDTSSQDQVAAWESQAGDALATINLEEGSWAQQAGNLLRAREDFQLAFDQARSPALREQATKALAALEKGEQPLTEVDEEPPSPAGCSTCMTVNRTEKAPYESDIDEETRFELLLATMPDELAARYLTAGPTFRKAWLAIQDGDETQALDLLHEIPESERDALYLFEHGALMARSGQHVAALRDLQAALAAEPNLFQAFDAMVDTLFALGKTDELEAVLKQSLAAERYGGYCWARLAELHAKRRATEPALAAGLKALEEGFLDQGLILLCAQLLEQSGQFDQAETLYRRLPGGGCGGTHPLLAEFWLRREQNLDQALESFKGALRQERDNPRWLLRIAQVYFAKGWHKEAAEQVERLMRQGTLPEPVGAEVKALADRLRQD